MKTVAYLRVATRSQDLANQKLAILEFSRKRRFTIDEFIESRHNLRIERLQDQDAFRRVVIFRPVQAHLITWGVGLP